MNDGYIVVEEDEDSGDSNDTLESSVLLHEIYWEEVFNEADNLIDDDPSLPYATQGTPLKKKRRRPGSRQPKFKRKPKGRKKGDYTCQPKAKPRASKVNAATTIISNSSHTDSETDVEGPNLSSADQRNLISLYYIHLVAPPPEEWNGEGRTVSKIVRALSYGKDQRRRVKEVIADYHFTNLVGGEYNPQRKSRTNTTAIEDESHIQHLVCDYIESGVSLTKAQLLIHIWCIKHGERTVMGRLVGNTPKVMPLDTCLFQDVKESVRNHVAMSLTIREPGVKDDCLFLMTMPKDAWHAYSWVFDPQTGVAPTSIGGGNLALWHHYCIVAVMW